jgi:translation initiation factor 2 alpha subunit (eIF-2alpha)
MALNKASLKSNLESRIKGIDLQGEDVPAKMAEILADEIDTYIKSQTITVNGVITVGSPTTQTQTVPVTATIQ